MHEVPVSLVEDGTTSLQEEEKGIAGAENLLPDSRHQVPSAVPSARSSSSSEFSKSKILVALKAKLAAGATSPLQVWKSSMADPPPHRKVKLLPLKSVSVPKPSSASRRPGVFRVCYLFAGPSRKADIRASLEVLCSARGMLLELSEIDLCYGAEHDMSDEVQWLKVKARIDAGEFDTVLITPPCSTWSRAPWANRKGPKPVRSRAYPWGYPWLRGGQKRKAELGSLLVRRALEAARSAWMAGSAFLLEHPEDLGRVPAGEPASIWQLEDTFKTVADTRGYHGSSPSVPVAWGRLL